MFGVLAGSPMATSHMYSCICMDMYRYTCIYLHHCVYICVHVYSLFTYTQTHTYTHTCIYYTCIANWCMYALDHDSSQFIMTASQKAIEFICEASINRKNNCAFEEFVVFILLYCRDGQRNNVEIFFRLWSVEYFTREHAHENRVLPKHSITCNHPICNHMYIYIYTCIYIYIVNYRTDVSWRHFGGFVTACRRTTSRCAAGILAAFEVGVRSWRPHQTVTINGNWGVIRISIYIYIYINIMYLHVCKLYIHILLLL